jgi:hypothetical protein
MTTMVTHKKDPTPEIVKLPRWDSEKRTPASETLMGFGTNPLRTNNIVVLRLLLRKGEPNEKSRACVAVYSLAKEDPEKARQAVPELKQLYIQTNALTKLLIVEALGAIVEGIGYPFGVLDKDFLELLKTDVKEAEARCHKPSVMDNEHHLLQFVTALKKVLGADGTITPIKK